MKILVTAGPTREFLDPVRFLSNRSTGKMGYAIAGVAVERGHAVRLISGPTSLHDPAGVESIPVVSAADMLEAVLCHLAWADVLIMCAAVADWRPRQTAAQKLKKNVMQGTLELERTADILSAVRDVRRPGQLIVGFAAETENVERYAREKCARKGLDLIVANDVSRADIGFGADDNAVSFITSAGDITELPKMMKAAVAENLLLWIEKMRG